MKLKTWKLRNEAGDGGDTGGGAPAGADAGATGGNPPAGGQPAADQSLLAGAATAAAAGAASPIHEAIPEKYRVNKDDGTFDLEASARKLAEGQANLEKRLGAGEVPPKSPEEYDLADLAETVDVDALKAEPQFQEFAKQAHELGLTNKQLSFVVKSMAELSAGQQAVAQENVQQQLREQWKTDQEFNANMGLAYKAASTLLDQADMQNLLKPGGAGDDPAVIRLLAKIGKEMQEDAPPAGANQSAEPDIQALLRSEAYNDPKHLDHKAVNARVQAYYQKTYGNAPVI
jgi:hypothetical protein